MGARKYLVSCCPNPPSRRAEKGVGGDIITPVKKATLVDPDATAAVRERFATWQEVDNAFRSLTALELKQLEQFARWCVRFSTNKSWDWEDLFHEVVALVFAGATNSPEEPTKGKDLATRGKRRWRTSVQFLPFIISVMKSLRSNAYHKFERRGGHNGVPCGLDDVVVGTDRDDDIAQDRWACITKLFWNDPDALKVLEGLRLGLTGKEIQGILGRPPGSPLYNTVRKRIARRVERLQDE